jgi:hypothetical protein
VLRVCGDMPDSCWPLLLSPASPGVSVETVWLVRVTCEPSSRVVVIIRVEVMIVSWGVSSSTDDVGLDEWLVVGASLLSSSFALEVGLLDDVGSGVDVAGVDVTGGFVGVDDVTGGGVDSGSSEVGSAGTDDDVWSGEAASVVSGSVFASSSCLRWIPFTLRPAILAPAKVASATDMAESPNTRNLRAELSCIVTDLVAVARQMRRWPLSCGTRGAPV